MGTNIDCLQHLTGLALCHARAYVNKVMKMALRKGWEDFLTLWLPVLKDPASRNYLQTDLNSLIFDMSES